MKGLDHNQVMVMHKEGEGGGIMMLTLTMAKISKTEQFTCKNKVDKDSNKAFVRC